jgi:hypothetical protein
MSLAPSRSCRTTPTETESLCMDGDSSEEGRPLGSAFRRVVLRPKAECHSDLDLPLLELSATTSPPEQQAVPPIPTIAQHNPDPTNAPTMGRGRPIKDITLCIKTMTLQED